MKKQIVIIVSDSWKAVKQNFLGDVFPSIQDRSNTPDMDRYCKDHLETIREAHCCKELALDTVVQSVGLYY